MNDADKTKKQLIEELQSLRAKINTEPTNTTQAQTTDSLNLPQTMANISEIILAHPNLDDLLDALAKELVLKDVFRSLTICLVDQPQQHVEVMHRTKRIATDQIEMNHQAYIIPFNCGNIIAEVAQTGKMQTIEGWDERFLSGIPSNEVPGYPDLTKYENKVSYFIPITQNNTTIAVFATGSNKSEKADMLQHIASLQPVFGQLAIAIRYAQLYQQVHNSLKTQVATQTQTLKEQNRFLQSIDTIGRVITTSLDLDEILDTLSEEIIKAGLFRGLTIALVKEHFIEFARALHVSPTGNIAKSPDIFAQKIPKTDKDIFADVARTGKLTIIEDGRDERLAVHQDWEDKIAYFVPVKAANRTIAVLGIGSTNAQKEQTLQRIDALHPLFNQVAIALNHAQLYQAQKEQTQIQEMCLRISQAVQNIITKNDIYKVLQTCLDELSHFHSQICSIALHRIQQDTRKQIETFRFDKNGFIKNAEQPNGEQPAIWDVMKKHWENKKIIYLSDLERDNPKNLQNLRKRFNNLPIQSLVDIPFDRGILSIHSLSKSAFSQNDIEIFQELTDILSLGLTRVEDLSYLQNHNTKQNALLQINRAIQSMIHPEDLKNVIFTIYEQLNLCEINFVGLAIHNIKDEKTNLVETFSVLPDGTTKKTHLNKEGVLQDWKGGKTIYRPNPEENHEGLPINYLETTYKAFNIRVRSMLNVPFLQGVFVLRSDTIDAFSQQDIRFAEQIVEILSLGISRANDLAEKEAQYQELENVYRYTPIGLFMVDQDLKLLRFNKHLAELKGLTNSDVGRTLYEIIPSQIGNREQHFKEVFDSGKPALNLKLQGHTPKTPDTQKTWLSSYYPLKSETGEVDRILGAVVDITESEKMQQKLQHSEAQLKKSEQHLRQILADMPIGVVLSDANAKILQTNPAALDLLGLTEDELLGKTALDPYWNVVREDGSTFKQEDFPIPTAIRTKQSVNNVYMGVYRPKTQDRIALLVNAEVQKNENGNVQTVVCSFLDITELKQTTEALKQNESLLNQAQKMAHLGSWRLDLNTYQVHLSQELCEIYDFDPSENITTYERVLEIIHPDDQQMIRDTTKQFVETGIIEKTDFRIIRKNGDIAYLSGQSQVMIDSEGQVIGLMGTLQDITEQRQIEAERQHTQRLRALGEMAAGISHNLNNLLTGILGPAQMLQITHQDPQVLEEVDTILTAGLRARDIVKRLNKGWRTDNEALEPIHINQVIREAIQTARPRWKDEPESRGIEIDIIPHLADDIAPIQGTQAGLNDILVNMIFNAVDAMPNGGKIALTTTQTPEYIRLLISDTGIGMSAETLERIFDPFFTTKGEVGTGLGLSTVYGTITRWGGNISVSSTEGQGTTFTLDFLISKQDTCSVPQIQSNTDTKAKGRVLLVEDEDVVARVLSRALSSHHIDVATSSSKALELFKSRQYDVLITDLGLPHMPGDLLANELRKQAPNLITILVSGWDLLPNDPRRKDFNFFVQKPFHDLDNLRQILVEALSLKNKNTSPKTSETELPS